LKSDHKQENEGNFATGGCLGCVTLFLLGPAYFGVRGLLAYFHIWGTQADQQAAQQSLPMIVIAASFLLVAFLIFPRWLLSKLAGSAKHRRSVARSVAQYSEEEREETARVKEEVQNLEKQARQSDQRFEEDIRKLKAEVESQSADSERRITAIEGTRLVSLN